MADKRVTGPIQVFVIGFDTFDATGQILAELRRVRRRGVLRVIDMLFVQKDSAGNISNSMHMTDLSEEERMRLGAVAGGLIGLRAGGVAGATVGAQLGALTVAENDAGLSADKLNELGDVIPPGSAAAILVVEHHWATRLRGAIADAGGRALMQAMISPDALALVGAELRAKIEAEEAIEEAEAVKMAAALEITQTLVEAKLIEDAAISEAAEAVATALAVEDAAAADVAGTLVAAGLIEEAATNEAARVVSESLAVEEEAKDVEQAAALRAVRALIAEDVIEKEAAEEAVSALVTAQLIDEQAAGDAVSSVLAP